MVRPPPFDWHLALACSLYLTYIYYQPKDELSTHFRVKIDNI